MRLLGLMFALLLALPFAAPAFADEHQPLQDVVMAEFKAETWVKTSKALVQVMVVAAGKAADAGTVRQDIEKALKGLDGEAQWRPINLYRMQDDAGLERWQAVYEARLNESKLSGINDKAKSASKAGMQISISNIQFTPELAETEAARAELRQQIYKQASDELAKLNTAMPGRNFRISGISFMGMYGGGVIPMQTMAQPMMMKAMAMGEAAVASADASSSSMAVETRMEQSATVSFSAYPVGEKAQ